MGVASAIFLVIVTIFCPPIAVFAISGCGADLFINICLTLLGYIPGHVHAFYLEYVYYDRRERLRRGGIITDRAPGVYSNNIQNGGNPHGYGTIVQPNAS